MVNSDAAWQAEAQKHSLECSPKEACGCVVIIKGRKRYWPCKNIAHDGEGFFQMDPDDYCKAEEAGEIIAIFHSHPNTPAQPSEADRMACGKGDLTWWITNPGTERWYELKPEKYEAPLVGRTWVWGVSDCWTLVRDWYKQELDIDLRDWARPTDPLDFQDNPTFDSSYEETDFVDTGSEVPEFGDLLLMSMESKGLNHIAVYIGENQILHHIRGRLSSRDVWGMGAYYQKITGRIIRHKTRC